MLLMSPVWGQETGEPVVAQGGQFIEGGVLDVDRATDESEAIVRGTLASERTDWVGRKIYTFYDLVASETVKGEAQTTITVAVPGGAKGKVATIWTGAPRLKTGDELVFFGKRFGQHPAFVAYGLFSGLVQVRTDPSSGKRVVNARGRTEDVEDFLQHVRSRRGRKP